VNLFQIILNLMEVMCLVKETMGNAPVGWFKLTRITSNNNDKNSKSNIMLVKHSRARPLWDIGTQ